MVRLDGAIRLDGVSRFTYDSNCALEMELPAAVSAHLDRIQREVEVSRARPAEQLA